MKYAADFRSIAREALRGKWGIAVIVGLVATLLGGIASEGPEVKLNVDMSGSNVSFDYAGQTIVSTSEGWNPGIKALLIGGTVYIALIAILMALLYFVLGSIIEIGYANFNLKLLAHQNPSYDTLFVYFNYWKTIAISRFLRSLYCLLWTLLFIVPGIVAAYSYAMTKYILAESPEMSASEAISLSKEMMRGNRWRLFCLHISFIGWDILSALTLGIGSLWLTPYKQASITAFYREISGLEV